MGGVVESMHKKRLGREKTVWNGRDEVETKINCLCAHVKIRSYLFSFKGCDSILSSLTLKLLSLESSPIYIYM
jgi:hypothetical protein